ncbi:PKD-like domain-containing protein [uncultured Alistipes sp.]|uniref:PKD-like domain-containing protein n=1 Tax=uncultured Alistipes sp. TaxID=538949 RepID=UPI0025F676A0|nr:PKD-like domain-containing protein [uncultured Alistipes sp.]
MKSIFKIPAILFAAALLWGCGDDKAQTEEAAVMPVVSYPVVESGMSVYVDAAVRFEAIIESSGPVNCAWYIDDQLVAATPTMTYVFRQIGTYSARFEAFNTVGRVERTYTVEAAGSPLEIEFSNEEPAIACNPGDQVVITATVVAGDKGVVHEWKVGDEVVSTTAEFRYTFPTMGDYTISYHGVNSDEVPFDRSWAVTVDELPLEIEFSNTDETILTELNAQVAITAIVRNGGTGLVHEWKVGADVLSTSYEFKHAFTQAGEYTIAYKGVNGKGETVTRSWAVTVDELPLEIEFSNTATSIRCEEGDEVTITATVKNGGAGLTHEWQLGGQDVSATAEFKHTFATAGSYTIAYKGVNGKNETVTRSWTVEVTEPGAEVPGYMFEDFEARTALPGHFLNGNPGITGITVEDNPYLTTTNPSQKVLRDLLQKETGTSGYFDMGFSHLANREKYRAIRVKVYLGGNLYYPRMKIASLSGEPNKKPSKINGVAVTEATTAAQWAEIIKTDDWNVFEYDLIDCGYGAQNFGNISTVQFRPLSNLTGGNMSGRDEVTNNRTVYFDDFEFLE